MHTQHLNLVGSIAQLVECQPGMPSMGVQIPLGSVDNAVLGFSHEYTVLYSSGYCFVAKVKKMNLTFPLCEQDVCDHVCLYGC